MQVLLAASCEPVIAMTAKEALDDSDLKSSIYKGTVRRKKKVETYSQTSPLHFPPFLHVPALQLAPRQPERKYTKINTFIA